VRTKPRMPKVETDVAVMVEDLAKVFPAPGGGTLAAVDGVSFSVARGEVFGFLGPNGAGKTTTLEIIEGLQSRHPVGPRSWASTPITVARR
jgi:ABC-type multidrug transport system ATPase subunit